MDTRITLQAIVQNAMADTRRLTDQLATLQTQASTGQKFTKISDDPSTAMSVLNYQTLAASYDTHLGNISSATARLNASVSTLQQVGDLFTQARSVAIEGSSSVNDASSFEALAKQVDAMLSRMLDLANTRQQDGAFIFSGTANRTQPFAVTSTDSQGNPSAVQYQGDGDVSRVFVDRAQQVALDYSGADIFQAKARQPSAFIGNTGAQSGAGTDNATGRANLTITHTTTSYAAGSGVQPGTSFASDTVLGPAGAHKLHITDTSGTGASGTVSLDGGPAIAFTNADTDLVVTNAAGETVHIDTTAISANFDGDVDITSDGAMSIDGGATSVPITFAADQSVTDSVTGNVTFVDTTNVTRTGNEVISYTGTSDAFQALMSLRDDLRNTRGLGGHDQILAISADLADLDRVHSHVLETVGTQSATLQSLESLDSHLKDLQLNAKRTASELGDVDMSDLVVKLQTYQNMLQLSLASFSRIMDQNLLDFLR